MIAKSRLNFLDASKGLFILFVIVAHSPIDFEMFNDNKSLYNLWLLFGTFGVGGFYIISGYMYGMSNKKTYQRIIKLLIPWFVSSMFVYFALLVVNNSGFDIFGYLQFFIGYKSFYYFLSVLIFFQVFYDLVPVRVRFLLPLISLTSIVLTQLNLIPYMNLIYLNPFNWLVFFWLGQMLKERNFDFYLSRISIFSLTVLSLTLLSFCIITNSTSYFSIQNVILQTSISFLIINYFKEFKISMIENIGKLSFTIYLWHIPFISLLNRIMFNQPLGFQVFKPLLALAFLYVLIKVYETLSNRIRNEKSRILLRTIFGLPN